MWLLKYPTQRVTVPGESFEITVVGGEERFGTREAALSHLVGLQARWPGLAAEIKPVLLNGNKRCQQSHSPCQEPL